MFKLSLNTRDQTSTVFDVDSKHCLNQNCHVVGMLLIGTLVSLLCKIQIFLLFHFGLTASENNSSI